MKKEKVEKKGRAPAPAGKAAAAKTGPAVKVELQAMTQGDQIKCLAESLGITQSAAREFVKGYAVSAKTVVKGKPGQVKLDVEKAADKAGLIGYLAEASRVKAADVRALLDLVTKAWVEMLKKNRRVVVQDLGILTVEDVEKRQARNPQTGDKMTIKAHKRVKFRVSSGLKKDIWNLK